jgi:hypothetical protein
MQGKQHPSFYLPNQLSRLSKKHSPSSEAKQEDVTKTLYLPKIKDLGKASSNGFEDNN